MRLKSTKSVEHSHQEYVCRKYVYTILTDMDSVSPHLLV